MNIYQVSEGPFHASECEGYSDYDDFYVVFALVEDPTRGALEEVAIEFSEYDAAQSLVDHFKQQIVPYNICTGDTCE